MKTEFFRNISVGLSQPNTLFMFEYEWNCGWDEMGRQQKDAQGLLLNQFICFVLSAELPVAPH